ncbi:hypothetical protein ABZ468_53825 [Streptomyces sp. NPDC005708]|uniref:hypothetical protein n=1 Tax=Streptomyces sp. NPDC005708 TaxID=3154564 RepID=UPI0033E63A15
MSQAIQNSVAAAFPDTPGSARPPVRRGKRHDPRERRRRHTVELFAASALGLVPWTLILGLKLPSDYQVHAWRTTWVGFDIMLLIALATTAVLGKRRNLAMVIPALATAVLLVCDAWFDVSLEFGTSAVWASVALAVFVELPMAAFIVHRMHKLMHTHCAPPQAEDPPAREALQSGGRP